LKAVESRSETAFANARKVRSGWPLPAEWQAYFPWMRNWRDCCAKQQSSSTLDIAAGASPVMAVCTALAHAGHKKVARVLAWDVCRLGDGDCPRREDKLRYIAFLNDGQAALLGADSQTLTLNLVAVFTEKVVFADRHKAAATRKEVEGAASTGIKADAEDRGAMKAAELYEEFGVATNIYT
jgi:hypothetical protein